MAGEYPVYLPENYGGSEASPLVVFLHESGECGTDPNPLRH
jgi:predicted peptidase